MKFEFSAGGIVFKKEDGNIFVLVSQHSQHHGWVFPKGLIGDSGKELNPPSPRLRRAKKETKQEAALREVQEETGVVGKILKELTPVSYWYVHDGQKIKKAVYYFLMEYVSGDIADHDFEMENVEWLPIDKVEERLTYKSDKQVWKDAKKVIESTHGGVA
ncbi:MAG: NUDIX domain-containing protein [Candidatus Levybacteria bacterium]|nr:NUDIX domain-containing protein [Candidatus Levybacteria bacterium]